MSHRSRAHRLRKGPRSEAGSEGTRRSPSSRRTGSRWFAPGASCARPTGQGDRAVVRKRAPRSAPSSRGWTAPSSPGWRAQGEPHQPAPPGNSTVRAEECMARAWSRWSAAATRAPCGESEEDEEHVPHLLFCQVCKLSQRATLVCSDGVHAISSNRVKLVERQAVCVLAFRVCLPARKAKPAAALRPHRHRLAADRGGSRRPYDGVPARSKAAHEPLAATHLCERGGVCGRLRLTRDQTIIRSCSHKCIRLITGGGGRRAIRP